MQAAQKPGVIINMGSASRLYPMYKGPIDSSSKGGVVLFTRSLAPYKRQGIRVNVLCPEFVQTDLAAQVGQDFIDRIRGYMPMDMVVKGAYKLIEDDSKVGACLWIFDRRGMEYWPMPAEEAKYLLNPSGSRKKSSTIAHYNVQISQRFEKLVVHTLSHNFHNATSIVQAPLRLPLKPDHVLLKIVYAGVNASDIEIVLEKTENFDELMVVEAEQREYRKGEE